MLKVLDRPVSQDRQPEAIVADDRPRHSVRLDIQGLRAIAVVSVVLNHLLNWPSGGFVGVDVFFVVSGYLITGLLLREQQKSNRISIAGFYRRRVKRIIPAAALVLFLTCTLTPVILGFDRARTTFTDGLWALLFVGNWRQYFDRTDYFGASAQPSPLEHFWSLGVEEQFYLVWPWLLILVFTLIPTRTQTQLAKARLIACATMGLIVAASFTWAIVQTASSSQQAYFSSFTRAWELGIGALVAMGARYTAKIPVHLRPTIAWAGLAGIIACIFGIDPELPFPGPWALAPVAATALVIAAGEGGYPERRVWVLSNPVSGFIGDISYSMYIVHLPVIVVMGSLVDTRELTYAVITLALILALAVASYYLVEDPVRRSTWLDRPSPGLRQIRHSRPAKVTVALLLAYSIAIVGVAAHIRSEPQESSTIPAYVSASKEVLCFGAAARAERNTCKPIDDRNLYPSPQDASEQKSKMLRCMAKFDAPAMRVCRLGERTKPKIRIALIGDSHASTLNGVLSDVADERKWQLDIYAGAGCRPGVEYRCPGMANALDTINREHYDVVLTTGFFDAMLIFVDGKIPAGPGVAPSIAAAWQRIIDSGNRLIVITDVPSIDRETVDCLTRVTTTIDSDCSVPRAGALRRTTFDRAVELTHGESVVDMTDLFCDQSRCRTIIGNVIVYADIFSHLTDTFSKTYGRYLADALEKRFPADTHSFKSRK
ncbi:acyltransferase family protein [Smaragdicoccus niigatensis]|uniref:acyltransferase family protein n=1 Tax=Smaragdicoccus niigatensis TaxID=359359 RepID=UPI00035FA96E|nr:acyltransferase family protein [Smaragdicoccus niigatensis]